MKMIISKTVLERALENVQKLELEPESWSCELEKINLHIGRAGIIPIPCVKSPLQEDNAVANGVYHPEKWNKLLKWLRGRKEQPLCLVITEDKIEVLPPLF